tara:strand:- start:1072 stop:1698 length:627 start_codon:yes stop_codon:yes gene_type:complete
MTFSLEKVMEVYWKYAKPTGTDTSVVHTPQNVDGPVPVVNISSNASQSFFCATRTSNSAQFVEPHKRVCGNNLINISSATSGFYQYNGVPYPYDLTVTIGYMSNITIIEDEDNLSSANRFGIDFGIEGTGGFYRQFSNGATTQNDLNKLITTYNPSPSATFDGVVTQDTFDGITVYKWKQLNGDGSGYFSMSFNDVPEMTGVEKYTFT